MSISYNLKLMSMDLTKYHIPNKLIGYDNSEDLCLTISPKYTPCIKIIEHKDKYSVTIKDHTFYYVNNYIICGLSLSLKNEKINGEKYTVLTLYIDDSIMSFNIPAFNEIIEVD